MSRRRDSGRSSQAISGEPRINGDSSSKSCVSGEITQRGWEVVTPKKSRRRSSGHGIHAAKPEDVTKNSARRTTPPSIQRSQSVAGLRSAPITRAASTDPQLTTRARKRRTSGGAL
eukprot:95848_1